MKIRTATEADISRMAEVYVTAFQLVDPSERWSHATSEALLSFFLRAQPDLVFVAESGSKIIGGICGMAKPWWDGHHLVQTEIFLDPSAQRKGVGRALFQHFLMVAKTRYNATHMESITFKNLDFPSSWYLKLGFQDKTDWKVVFGEVDVLAERLNVEQT